jgi:hypothetical protein
VELGRDQHPEERRRQVYPQCRPPRRVHGRGDGAGRVQAHPGERRLHDDEGGDERRCAQPRESAQAWPVRDDQDDGHQDQRHESLGGERDPASAGPRRRGRVAHGRMRDRGTKPRGGDADPGDPPGKLRQDVEDRVPARHLAETPERERHGRVQVSAGPLAPPGVDDGHRGRAHGEPHGDPAQQGIGDRLPDGRARVLEHGREHAGRDHEDPEPRSLHQVLRPVATQGRQAPGPGGTRGVLGALRWREGRHARLGLNAQRGHRALITSASG